MSFIKRYAVIPKTILLLILAEFVVQIINSSFMNSLPIYVSKLGFTDDQNAIFISYRFFGVLFFAFPFGILIKKLKLIPFFYLGTIGAPLAGLTILHAISNDYLLLTKIAMVVWGISFMFIQVGIIPFILRNCKQEHHTEAISLSFATWSIAGIFSGSLFYLMSEYAAEFLTEKNILQLFCIVGSLGVPLVFLLKGKENPPNPVNNNYFEYDWNLILKATMPTLLIAIGAGLTIPFIGLFFHHIHHFTNAEFSLLASITTGIVFFSVINVPSLKDIWGYKKTILLTQCIAIIALVVLGFTQIMPLEIGVVIAIACYMLRQPLMNIGGPITTDLSMKYVGEKNRELISSITSAIWSGSWFFSANIFSILRKQNVNYYMIFLITGILYGIGVLFYYRIIREYESRSEAPS